MECVGRDGHGRACEAGTMEGRAGESLEQEPRQQDETEHA